MAVIPDRIGYGYGRYLLTDLATRWIPRELWSGKPDPPHSQISREIAPRSGGEPQANIAYSVLLHGYLDFGLAGALLLAAYGIGYRWLYEWFMQHRRSIPAMLLFSITAALIPFALRDNPVDALVRFASIMLPIAVAYGLTMWRIARS